MQKKNKKNVMQISTSTLGGAIFMFLFSFILGPQAPWIIEKIRIRNKTEFTMQKLFQESSRISGDRKDFIVEPRLGYKIMNPGNSWISSTENPGTITSNELTVADVPYFKWALSMFTASTNSGYTKMDDIITFTLIKEGNKCIVKFTDSSEIDGYKIAFNPAENDDFAKASLRGSAKVMGLDSAQLYNLLEDSSETAKDKLSQYISAMLKQVELLNMKNIPGTFDVRTMLRINSISINYMRKSPLFAAIVHKEKSTLPELLGILTLSNKELMSTSIKDMQISSDNNAILMDVSIPLNKVIINDKYFAETELTRMVILIKGNSYIHIIAMQILNASKDYRKNYIKLKEVFESFQVANKS